MIEGQSPVIQALLGTLLTWGLTLAGAAMALFLHGNQRKLLDTSLGFAAGVMLAASYWSLLEPALEMASGMGTYGDNGEWAFLPVSIGLLLGAAFVYAGEKQINFNQISFTQYASYQYYLLCPKARVLWRRCLIGYR